jgi:hypothetical protein
MNMGKQQVTISEFYCTQCGKRGIAVPRKKGAERKGGHLKKLFCLHCNMPTNHVEIKPFTKYGYEEFKLEFDYGNFSEKGERIQPFGVFKDNLYKQGVI